MTRFITALGAVLTIAAATEHAAPWAFLGGLLLISIAAVLYCADAERTERLSDSEAIARHSHYRRALRTACNHTDRKVDQ